METEEEKAIERRISFLEAKNEELDQEVSKAEKEAAIREMKRSHGKNWKKILFGAAKSIKINRETMQTLHSMGSNERLRSLNDPREFGSSRRTREVFRE